MPNAAVFTASRSSFPVLVHKLVAIAANSKAVSLPLGIGWLPVPRCTGHVSPIPEDILEIGVLQGLMLQTSAGEFHPQLHVVKPL